MTQPVDPLQQAQDDVNSFLNGDTSGPDAQARAQAAQNYINWATKPLPADPAARAQAQQQLQASQAMYSQYLQGMRDATSTANNAATNQTRSSIAAGNDQTRLTIAGGNNATSLADTQVRADATLGAADTRAGATLGAAGIRAGASVNVANISAAAKIQAIQQKAQADLQLVDQKFEQQLQMLSQNEALKKDLYGFQSQLGMIRDEHMQQAMAIRQEAVAAQQQEFERPFREASSQAELENADTAQQKAAQDLKLQQAQLQLGMAKDQSQMADSSIQSGLKLGVAPPAALAKMQFAPFAMAQQVLSQLVANGQIHPSRVDPQLLQSQQQPAAGAPAPAPVAAEAPNPMNQFASGGMGPVMAPPPTSDQFGGAPAPAAAGV